jgi:two-component system LytT family response regulator
MDGFEVLREISPEQAPLTIFVTGYDKYAIPAFEAHALDCLLKPFSDERFEAARQRARHYIRPQPAGERGLRFARLPGNQVVAREGSEYLERVLIRSAGRAGAKSYLYRATAGQIRDRLDPRRVVRVHCSTMVNTSRIVELQPRTHGDYVVVLKGGVELTLSRGHRAEFESWLRQPL